MLIDEKGKLFGKINLLDLVIVLLVVLVLYLRNHCLIQGHEDSLLCFLLRVL